MANFSGRTNTVAHKMIHVRNDMAPYAWTKLKREQRAVKNKINHICHPMLTYSFFKDWLWCCSLKREFCLAQETFSASTRQWAFWRLFSPQWIYQDFRTNIFRSVSIFFVQSLDDSENLRNVAWATQRVLDSSSWCFFFNFIATKILNHRLITEFIQHSFNSVFQLIFMFFLKSMNWSSQPCQQFSELQLQFFVWRHTSWSYFFEISHDIIFISDHTVDRTAAKYVFYYSSVSTTDMITFNCTVPRFFLSISSEARWSVSVY